MLRNDVTLTFILQLIVYRRGRPSSLTLSCGDGVWRLFPLHLEVTHTHTHSICSDQSSRTLFLILKNFSTLRSHVKFEKISAIILLSPRCLKASYVRIGNKLTSVLCDFSLYLFFIYPYDNICKWYTHTGWSLPWRTEGGWHLSGRSPDPCPRNRDPRLYSMSPTDWMTTSLSVSLAPYRLPYPRRSSLGWTSPETKKRKKEKTAHLNGLWLDFMLWNVKETRKFLLSLML